MPISSIMRIASSDRVIWNKDQVILDIAHYMAIDKNILIDLNNEGPCCDELGLYDILEKSCNKFNYDITRITILTANALETHPSITIKYKFPMHLANWTKRDLQLSNIAKNTTLKHFGIFIGRSNAPRLILATYLNDCTSKTVMSFHYNATDDYHMHNIGLEDAIRSFGVIDATQLSNFISFCPVKLDDSKVLYPIPEDQANDIHPYYKKFFVEIVCETYYSGNTFFPTEKTWRPIAMKTPFIIQGPVNFLNNLKKLGFRTFDQWWDEGYSEDSPQHALQLIKGIILDISKKTNDELRQLHSEMKPILEHNYTTLMNLTKSDFTN